MTRLLCRTLLLALLSGPAAAADASYWLIISGLGGERQFSELFDSWANTLSVAIRDRFGVSDENITYLAEPADDGTAAGASDGLSTREGIGDAFAKLAGRLQASDQLMVVLLGHGNAGEDGAYFNIPGPDLSADEFAELLQPLSDRAVAVINTASASGPFVKALSGPKRIVITATESGSERFHTLFGGYFAAAFAEPGADMDKDQRLSLLEAFEYARREVEREYESDQRLRTEHALLDDNGDGEGSQQPGPENGDGAVARRVMFQAATVTAAAAENPALQALLDDKQEIEQRIELLKANKADLASEDYELKLEDLLVELALLGQQIRQLSTDAGEAPPPQQPADDQAEESTEGASQ